MFSLKEIQEILYVPEGINFNIVLNLTSITPRICLVESVRPFETTIKIRFHQLKKGLIFTGREIHDAHSLFNFLSQEQEVYRSLYYQIVNQLTLHDIFSITKHLDKCGLSVLEIGDNH